ncbi:PREDICTED: Ig-like V-type domain-containing protein FAM187A [Mesitornis unicolor]|uniref:Ig-like V-type domain-containing protein FAM187A n=1 Tax=Mesitornis unicolor TaxID=54374 RepID=UPI00052920B7|nr:PREDICTED: Ig-like V-type domain-containing protein FAM187A [Mesitornis unicolor]
MQAELADTTTQRLSGIPCLHHKTKVLTDFAGTMVVDSGHIRSSSDVLKRFSIRMFSLIVFRAQVSDSGHYICGSKRGDYFYGYDVDVQPTGHVTVAFLDRGQHVQEDVTQELFSLFTTFWDWTVCDRCGVRGEQRRIGQRRRTLGDPETIHAAKVIGMSYAVISGVFVLVHAGLCCRRLCGCPGRK